MSHSNLNPQDEKVPNTEEKMDAGLFWMCIVGVVGFIVLNLWLFIQNKA